MPWLRNALHAPHKSHRAANPFPVGGVFLQDVPRPLIATGLDLHQNRFATLTAGESSMSAMPAQPSRILLAEDDRFLRKAGEAALRRNGYTVITALDGEEALQKARQEKPDLILLDVIMPKLQGFEVLKRLKADAETRDIPIIMLSNLGQDSDVQEALKAGAVEYLVKANLKLDQLASRVADVLAKLERP
jgi:CheY-like chemotaxis protein